MTKINDFIAQISDSLHNGSFVKLTLGAYKGSEPDLKKITARRVVIKGEDNLSFTYSYKTRDITKNDPLEAALRRVSDALKNGFGVATLFDTRHDIAFPSMKKSKPTQMNIPPASHDIPKNRHVKTHGKSFFHDLGITDRNGTVLKSAQDKYRQIDKYIEILGGLIGNDRPVRIVDMGAGKGYLTFALYDYLIEKNVNARVTGVEYRKDLVDLCNKIATQSNLGGLSFEQGTIQSFNAKGTNVLIALHACDTATDDAIAKGIQAEAELIVVAPCCHKQIRREMESSRQSGPLDFMLKYGTLLERQAEMVTDAMRGLLLEYAGYSVKLFEFVSDAHTPKNVMIVAQKTGRSNPKALKQLHDAKAFFGIEEHALETAILLDNNMVKKP